MHLSSASFSISGRLRKILGEQKLLEHKLSHMIGQLSTDDSAGVLRDFRACTQQLQQLCLRLERDSIIGEDAPEGLPMGLWGSQRSSACSTLRETSEALDPKAIPRSLVGVAFAATPGQYILLEPLFTKTIVYDEWNVQDTLGKCPWLLFAYCWLIYAANGIAAVLGSVVLLWEPVVIMVYTNLTDVMLLEGRYKTIQQICLVVHWLFVVSTTLGALDLLMLTNSSTVRRLFRQSWQTVILTTLLGLAYAGQATLLCRHPAHVGWLTVFVVVLILMQMSDAVAIHFRLRTTPEGLQKFIGKPGFKVSVVSFLYYWMCVQFVLCDTFRHHMIIYSTSERSMLKIDIPHPITKNIVETTNHSLAQETYIPTIIFYASTVATVCTSGGMGHVTAVLKTQFRMSEQLASVLPLEHLHVKRDATESTVAPPSEGVAPFTKLSSIAELQQQSNARLSAAYAMLQQESDASLAPIVLAKQESTKACCAGHAVTSSTTTINNARDGSDGSKSIVLSPDMVEFLEGTWEKDQLLPCPPAATIGKKHADVLIA